MPLWWRVRDGIATVLMWLLYAALINGAILGFWDLVNGRVTSLEGARVIAVDRNPEALAVAKRLGADHILVADCTDVPAAVTRLTDGGSHVSVDAVGSEQTSADAILGLRRRGRHVQIGLLPPVDGHPRVPLDRVIAWELDLLGSHGMAATDYPGMLALIESGALQPQLLIERTIGLEQAAELLPGYDRAVVVGMTMVDPTR